MIAIGIDTGGTCTDAVIYDVASHEVLSYGKTLTTKKDLKIGILEALRCLDQELLKKAEHISLSTTLATNACVEGKGGRAKLVFIGVKPAFVEKMQGTYGLPPVSEIYFLAGDAGQDVHEENKPDWDHFRTVVKEQFREFDSVAVVQMNPKYNDGKFELEAEAIIKEELGVPCVRGYDLYQEINVQKRGATALLNARLLPVMNDFFASIDSSLEELELELPILVVKSDGSIMSREYAMSRPVETLLCGPAASIIGAMELSSQKDALIVDMGGTTSDVALVKNGAPVTSASGISIGEWQTMVKGVTIDTFALGGDSAVEYEDNQLYLDRRRVVPLCMAAAKYPDMVTKLQNLVSTYAAYSYPANQFFMLLNEPENIEKYTPNERKLIASLAEGPLIFDEAAEAVGISPYIFKTKRLEDEGVIIRCGVTPTDVMHIYGDYTDYSVEASKLGIDYLHIVLRKPMEEICQKIYNLAKSRLYNNLVRIFMQYETGKLLSADNALAMEKLTGYIFDSAKRENGFQFLQPTFAAKIGLTGIGAPTRIFLRDVAHLLGTEADIPEYAKVANAIGAAVGSIVSEYVVKIEPCAYKGGFGNFMVTGGAEVVTFEYYDQALEEAKRIAEERAYQRAMDQGAKGDIKVDVAVFEDYYDLVGGEAARLFLETKVIGKAAAE